MRIIETYSHLNGLEFLLVHKPELWQEIQDVVAGVDATVFKTKASKEKTMLGRMLYAPKEMNAAMNTGFQAAGWRESRTSYWVTKDAKLIRKTMHLTTPEQKEEIKATGEIPILSYNQTDFVKGPRCGRSAVRKILLRGF